VIRRPKLSVSARGKGGAEVIGVIVMPAYNAPGLAQEPEKGEAAADESHMDTIGKSSVLA
jgi:hypothetical protein